MIILKFIFIPFLIIIIKCTCILMLLALHSQGHGLKFKTKALMRGAADTENNQLNGRTSIQEEPLPSSPPDQPVAQAVA